MVKVMAKQKYRKGCVERKCWGRVEYGLMLCDKCPVPLDSKLVCHATKIVKVPKECDEETGVDIKMTKEVEVKRYV